VSNPGYGPRRKIYSVIQITQYIRELLEGDILLNGVFVEGEISNYRPNKSGHMYFTLKDDDAAINCVMFRSYASGQPFEPENGMKMLVGGYVSLYEKTGQYQLYAQVLQPVGVGALHLAYEQLKRKLEDEGLFDAARKRGIPAFPSRVAVVTSPSGAVARDIINIAGRRNRGVELVIVPTPVQGPLAAREIAEAIRLADRRAMADVIILARGGGSMEDLWAFNEEPVARAVYASRTPVVSAIGHETDYTIADFAADLRAPTPSAAAELVIPRLDEMRGAVMRLKTQLCAAASFLLAGKREQAMVFKNSRALAGYRALIKRRGELLAAGRERLARSMDRRLRELRTGHRARAAALDALSPLKAIERGFCAVFDEGGAMMTSADAFEIGDAMRVKFRDGDLRAVVSGKDLSI